MLLAVGSASDYTSGGVLASTVPGCTHISIPSPALCWYLVDGEGVCVSQGIREQYRRGLNTLAGLINPGRYHRRE